MSWIIEIAFNGGDTGETTELLGSYIHRGKAEADALWLQEEIDRHPRDPNRWVVVSVRSISKPKTRPELQAISEEARVFLEPGDDEEVDYSSGMYSIDHGGSGHE